MRSVREILNPTRGTRTLFLSVAVGFLVAILVAGFEYLAAEVLLHELIERPLWQVMLAPTVGLVVARAILLVVARTTSTATSDEYNRAFHERHPRIRLLELPGKLLAGVATIGSGGSLGLEGPSIYAGSSVGVNIGARLQNYLSRDDARVLLTAGAAAGVAAVFKAPATGVIFALEAPYRDDVSRRGLMPALLASATSYVTFVSILGSEPVLSLLAPGVLAGLGDTNASVLSAAQLEQLTEVQFGDLIGAVLLGVGAGLGGRFFASLVRRAKSLNHDVAIAPRIAVSGAMLAVLALVADYYFDEPLTIGPGPEAVEWVLEPDHGLGIIALLFGLRLASTIATLGGGGVGGLFIPLATQGVILGQFIGEAVDTDRPGLYPTLGLAAFLAAGYRVPIAAVMFVAEVSPVGSFVVPALIAAALSQIVAGNGSVAAHQRSERRGHLENRFTLPITTALTTDVLTVPPDASTSEFVYGHVLGRRERSVAVVDGSQYLGMVSLREISELERGDWDATPVSEIMRTDVPAARPSWTLRDAVAGMEKAAVDLIAVTDADNTFIGVIYEDDILKLDEILDETGG